MMDDAGMAEGTSSGAGAPINDAQSMEVECEQAMGNVLARLTGRRPTTTKVGRYELGKRIGAGACGAVYEARDPALDRQVAVKVVLPRPRGGGPPEAQTRLLREAKALAKLGHPNVVEIFDVGVQTRPGRRSDQVFIVMELIDGPTLDEWRKNTRPSTAAIVGAYAAAARGLAAAHSVGVVHRDFKPANAMMTTRGRVKVLDFGLAREDLGPASVTDPPESTGPYEIVASDASDSLTRTGTVLGTPRYMAPEQHAAEPVTAASDQYSLCVATWEAVVDAPPFSAKHLRSLAEEKWAGPPARPAAMDPALYAVLARGLAAQPSARWPDTEQLAAALSRLASPRRRRGWPWAVAALAGAVGASVWLASVGAPSPGLCSRPDPSASWSANFDAVVDAAKADANTPKRILHPRVAERLTRFQSLFAQTRDGVCTDPHLPAAQRAQRAECLERGQRTFEALLDPSTPLAGRHVARRLMSLAIPTRCLDDDPLPLYTRATAEEDEIDALLDATRETDVDDVVAYHATLDAGIARTRALSDHYAATELMQRRFDHALVAGDSDEVARWLTEAIWEAETAHDHLLATELYPVLLLSFGDGNRPRAEVDAAIARAEELLEATGHPPYGTAGLYAAQSLMLVRRGDFEGIVEVAARARTVVGDPPLPGTERHVALLAINEAIAQWNMGDPYAAEATLRSMLGVLPDAKWSHSVRAPAYRLLGQFASERGDQDAELQSTIQQRESVLHVVGPDHPTAHYLDADIGRALVLAGRATEGLEKIANAYRRLSDFDGELSMKLAYVALWGAQTALATGDAELALQYASGLLDHCTALQSPETLTPADAHGFIAAAHLLAGDLAEAREAAKHAGPPEDVAFEEISLALGQLALLDRRPAEAADAALRVLEHQELHDGSVLANNHRADAYALLAAAARAQGHGDDAATYDILSRERLERADPWHRARLTASPP
jgi:serine/threonine protein kinase